MKNLYELRYKEFGGPKNIVFDAADLEDAKRLGREWCTAKSFRFVIVRQFYSDLAAEIKEIQAKEAAKTPPKIKTDEKKVA